MWCVGAGASGACVCISVCHTRAQHNTAPRHVVGNPSCPSDDSISIRCAWQKLAASVVAVEETREETRRVEMWARLAGSTARLLDACSSPAQIGDRALCQGELPALEGSAESLASSAVPQAELSVSSPDH